MSDVDVVSRTIATGTAGAVAVVGETARYVLDLSALPWESLAIGTLAAAIGGAVNSMRHMDNPDTRRSIYIRDICYGAFAGFVSILVAGKYRLEPFETLLIAAVAGLLGNVALDWYRKWLLGRSSKI